MSERELARLAAENEALRRQVAELERKLAESQSAAVFLESVLDAVPAFISNLDPDLNIRFLNRYQPGHTAESVRGKSVFEYIAPEQHAIAREHIERARATGQVTSYTLTNAVGSMGEIASYLTRVAPVREPDGRIGICLAFLDITEERRREHALEETRQNLQLALEGTGLGLWSWDTRTNEVVWDERMQALHGSSEGLPPDRYLPRYVHPDDQARVGEEMASASATGNFPQTRYRIVRADGSVRWVMVRGRTIHDADGKLVKVVGGTLDVTHQQTLEEQLRQAQKMEAVGSLTAGIAHNFNNMLAVIVPTLELAERLVPSEQERLMRQASYAARRASELVRQLMTYAGQTASQNVLTCDVHSLVEASVGICRRAFDTHITLTVEHGSEPLIVTGNPVQLEQVLVNLLVNARDAVLESNAVHGMVSVHVRTCESDALGGGNGHSVCIDVIDNGVGMSEQVRARIFEPFFTTKSVGKGTGLGLATSYAIVRDHGGSLSCAPAPGGGTIFTILLPASGGELLAPEEKPEPRVPVGTRVLLVDDDDAVRSTLCHVLGDFGITVREARNGDEALGQLSSHPDTDVVLLDRAMPGGPGERFVRRMREVAPHVRVVFLTGQDIHPEQAALVDAVVAKPVRSSALLTAIEQVLAKTQLPLGA